MPSAFLTDKGDGMFSDIVVSILEASGWAPNRKVPTSQWAGQLESEGFTMLPDAVKVLEGFGGLEIVPRKTAGDTFLKGVVRFDPLLSASGEFDRVDYWQHRLNIKLSPIAEDSKGGIVLLADDGRVFICWDGKMLFIGESFEDALENSLIVAKRKAVEVGHMPDLN
jgi:SUKH-3 immunity protein